MFFRYLPVISRPKPGLLQYGIPFARRLAALGLGAVVFFLVPLIADPNLPRALFWVTGAIIASAALSEDRWIFEMPNGGVVGAGPSASGETALSESTLTEGALAEGALSEGRLTRNFGLLPLTRSWRVSLSEVEAIELRGGAPSEPISGGADQRSRFESSLFGAGRHPWRALVLKLADGRILVLAAGKVTDETRLRASGAEIAGFVGIRFEERCG